jgi:hypothetical protein
MATLERRDLTRQRIEKKNQARGLVAISAIRCLSGAFDASRIEPVSFSFSLFTVRGSAI